MNYSIGASILLLGLQQPSLNLVIDDIHSSQSANTWIAILLQGFCVNTVGTYFV
jgi:hypothetical protein